MPFIPLNLLTVGSATIDIFTTLGNQEVERLTLHNADSSFMLLEEGSKGDADSIEDYFGGGAVNTAVAAARLGAKVDCLVKVGDDLDADRMVERLGQENISANCFIRAGGQKTGRAVLIDGRMRNPTIFSARGANTTLDWNDVSSVWRDKHWQSVHISPLSGAAHLVCDKLISKASSDGAFISINPGIKQIIQGWELLNKGLGHVNLLSLNRREGYAMLEKIQGPITEMRPSELALSLLKTGAQYVALTDGDRGAYLAYDNKVDFVAAKKCEVKGTAGAGDCFSMTLALGLASKLAIDDALGFALKNAASVVGHRDTLTGLMTQENLINDPFLYG